MNARQQNFFNRLVATVVEDFETHESGTFARITEKDIEIVTLKKRNELLKKFLAAVNADDWFTANKVRAQLNADS